ncbi:MAG: SDR family NAD(P)-dependent oxidoreductase [Chitinophagaceae bacterium]|nr:SDR family NAD(P)-dependent oxidoreductase [Chitinophagaceae bacterium]
MQRVIWVTGSTGNLGAAVCRRFLREGDRVIGTILPSEALAQVPAAEGLEYRPLDLLDEQAVQKDVEAIAVTTGRIDVAVLTAGGFAMGDIGETGLEDIHQQLRLNFDTAYNAARPVFRHMMSNGRGRIFMVGSRPGMDMRDGKGMTAYSLSKSLVFRLAELMNREAHDSDVVTCVLVPGTIDTPQNRASMPGADFSAWVSPDAIAETIHYHSLPEAAHLREPVLKVYGRS